MKIDRLIGILSILLQKEKVTAPELAQVFEVPTRTINRDIDDLCRAGIPIVTSQGTGGGNLNIMHQKETLKERLSHTIWFSNGQVGMCMDTVCLEMISGCSS